MRTDLLLTAGIIGAIALILNMVFLLVMISMQRRMSAVGKWPSTTGSVLMSELQQRHTSDGGTVHYPFVQYSYQVQAQNYRSTKIMPGPEVGGSGASKIIARYPVGSQVPVFYDPKTPSESVLEKKASALGWMWFILILLDFSICILTPFMVWMFEG